MGRDAAKSQHKTVEPWSLRDRAGDDYTNNTWQNDSHTRSVREDMKTTLHPLKNPPSLRADSYRMAYAGL